jgi:hypothetical protein
LVKERRAERHGVADEHDAGGARVREWRHGTGSLVIRIDHDRVAQSSKLLVGLVQISYVGVLLKQKWVAEPPKGP